MRPVFALSLAILLSSQLRGVEFSYELIASKHGDGTRSSTVRVNGVRSALPDGSSGVRDACATADGKYVFFTHGLGRYHLPATQLDRGWISSSAISVFDGTTGRRINTFLLDDPNRGAANPWGIAVDAKWLAIASAGTHEVSLIPIDDFLRKMRDYQGDASTDLSFMRAVGRRRIRLEGQGPRKISFRSDGKLVVKLHFAETTAIIDPETGKVDEPKTQGGLSARVAADPEKRGEAYFNDATLCYQGWQSCASCHPDGKTDGLTWDFPFSGGGLGHPEETPDLTKVKVYRRRQNDYHINLYDAPKEMLEDNDRYVRGLGK